VVSVPRALGMDMLCTAATCAPPRARRSCAHTGSYACESDDPDADDIDGQLCRALQRLGAALQHSPTLDAALRTVRAGPLWRRCGVFVSESDVDRRGLFVDVGTGSACPPFTILALLGHARNGLARGFRYNNGGPVILWDRDETWEAGWANTCYPGDRDAHGRQRATNAVFRSVPFAMPHGARDSLVVLVSTREIPMTGEVFAEYPADFDDSRVSRADAGLPPLAACSDRAHINRV